MLSAIRNAIEERKILEIDYPPGKRIIEPHALGYSSDGKLLLRAFQTDGASATGKRKDWKLFSLDRVNGISSSGGNFGGVRLGYRRGDSAMKGGIVAQL